jgi:ABC-type Fe3+ transport system substrate-binding protein
MDCDRTSGSQSAGERQSTEERARVNAAKLFIDFILSKEGQSIIYDVKRNPTRMDLSQPVARVAKIKLMEMDSDQRAKNYNRYTQEFREIFSLR